MHTKISSATTIGVVAHEVDVEVDLSLGLMQFNIVGLPDAAIKESRQRILTALKNCGIRIPDRRITVNLAPADLKKEGTLFDLPIALGILQAAQQISIPKEFLSNTIWFGELSLDGSIKPVRGALPIAYDALHKLNKRRLVLPKNNAQEAALIENLEVIGVDHLVELINYVRGEITIEPTKNDWRTFSQQLTGNVSDFSQVKGQRQAKRALQIAAAGRHNVLFVGSPGSGKTMLAQRLPSIMPPLTFHEIIETSKVYSISGKLSGKDLVLERPFRAPHHTISQAGLIGGGSNPQPGEVSLAHHGILFLDELTEFKHHTLEVLRQPMESKNVCIARATQTLEFPADFLLISALNPCPCGFFGDKKKNCRCSQVEIRRYLQKLSGPLLDRIDLQVHVQSVEYETIKSTTEETSSKDLFTSITKALEAQNKRFECDTRFNHSMNTDEIKLHCKTTDAAEEIIKKAFNQLNLSMRGYHKILKVARTIADLEGLEYIDVAHVQEAITYRALEQTLERMQQD
jgi:magnesium chelatase family protein